MTKPHPSPDRKAFGRALKKARQDAGLSQQELADKANLSREHISRLENGDGVPGADTVSWLATALSCGVETLTNALQTKRAKRAA